LPQLKGCLFSIISRILEELALFPTLMPIRQ
jgi:hypothetical protein